MRNLVSLIPSTRKYESLEERQSTDISQGELVSDQIRANDMAFVVLKGILQRLAHGNISRLVLVHEVCKVCWCELVVQVMVPQSHCSATCSICWHQGPTITTILLFQIFIYDLGLVDNSAIRSVTDRWHLAQRIDVFNIPRALRSVADINELTIIIKLFLLQCDPCALSVRTHIHGIKLNAGPRSGVSTAPARQLRAHEATG
mmetsp:Transcript_33766/g.89653  ORF Transcript_33766/g.89653 Transcript_33766/m.89653 type:complete len:202 (+) Transcript_33766:406-1011(+)